MLGRVRTVVPCCRPSWERGAGGQLFDVPERPPAASQRGGLACPSTTSFGCCLAITLFSKELATKRPAAPRPTVSSALDALRKLRADSNGVALVFTDIVDSTALVTQIGDPEWSRLLERHLASCFGLMAINGGVEVDTAGDGVLCAFARVVFALKFAQALQANPGDELLSVRAGIHFGELFIRDVGACGQLVHFGARVVAHAKGAEIWLSGPARSQLASEDEDLLQRISSSRDEECQLKGIPGVHTLWRAVSYKRPPSGCAL
jgi:class 3 adenylate cyclase